MCDVIRDVLERKSDVSGGVLNWGGSLLPKGTRWEEWWFEGAVSRGWTHNRGITVVMLWIRRSQRPPQSLRKKCLYLELF